MTIIGPVESERVMYSNSNDPAALRQRMLLPNDDEISEDVLLGALRSLDPEELADALDNFSDSELRYLNDLLFD